MKHPASILVFAKAPVPGLAKTRLIPALGRDGAADFQAALTRRSLGTVCTAFPGAVTLCCTPDTSDPWFQGLAAEFSVRLWDQLGADLGARMDHALTQALVDHERAILIGTDCPVLTSDMLRDVDTAMKEGEAETVIVPAEDGGYVLVALSRPFPTLFTGIEWGTERVLTETVHRIDEDGRPARILSPLWDIDEPDDLKRLRRQRPDIYNSVKPNKPMSEEIDR